MRLDHLVRLISQPWAIHPEILENWCQILDAKLSGVGIPNELAESGRASRGGEDEPFIRDGNVAIVPVVGTLVKANTFFSCDATYAEVRRAVLAAEGARGIDAIILDGDTPGGTVAGAQETGDFLAKVNQRKPVFGWVDDLAASAGYWLLSQTRMIGAHPAADIGSIGVLTVHYDRSLRDEKAGVRRKVLAVGDYKAAGNDTAPLSPEAEAYIMDRLNQTYGLFISAVTRGRQQLTPAAVREMQSRVYKAAQARELGLIDQVMGRDEYIEFVKQQVKGSVSTIFAKGEELMDLATLRKEHPDLVARIESEARQGLIAQADADSAKTAAVAAERERIVAILGIPGPAAKAHHGLLVEGIKDGKTAGDVALAIQHKEAELLTKVAEGMAGGAPVPAPPADPGTGSEADARAAAASDAMVAAAKDWAKRN